MLNLGRDELTSYLLLLLGVTVDQISTKIGLTREYIYESNTIAAHLIEHGVWGYTDLLICIIFIAITYLAQRVIQEEKQKILFVFPLISGTIRLVTGIINLALL